MFSHIFFFFFFAYPKYCIHHESHIRFNSKQRKIRASELLKNTTTEDGTIEMPQNLKRKAVAKRPTLGHVVPSNLNKTKGG